MGLKSFFLFLRPKCPNSLRAEPFFHARDSKIPGFEHDVVPVGMPIDMRPPPPTEIEIRERHQDIKTLRLLFTRWYESIRLHFRHKPRPCQTPYSNKLGAWFVPRSIKTTPDGMNRRRSHAHSGRDHRRRDRVLPRSRPLPTAETRNLIISSWLSVVRAEPFFMRGTPKFRDSSMTWFELMICQSICDHRRPPKSRFARSTVRTPIFKNWVQFCTYLGTRA